MWKTKIQCCKKGYKNNHPPGFVKLHPSWNHKSKNSRGKLHLQYPKLVDVCLKYKFEETLIKVNYFRHWFDLIDILSFSWNPTSKCQCLSCQSSISETFGYIFVRIKSTKHWLNQVNYFRHWFSLSDMCCSWNHKSKCLSISPPISPQ